MKIHILQNDSCFKLILNLVIKILKNFINKTIYRILLLEIKSMPKSTYTTIKLNNYKISLQYCCAEKMRITALTFFSRFNNNIS